MSKALRVVGCGGLCAYLLRLIPWRAWVVSVAVGALDSSISAVYLQFRSLVSACYTCEFLGFRFSWKNARRFCVSIAFYRPFAAAGKYPMCVSFHINRFFSSIVSVYLDYTIIKAR